MATSPTDKLRRCLIVFVKQNKYINRWSRVFLEKLKVPNTVKKFPAFYRAGRFITTFRTAT